MAANLPPFLPVIGNLPQDWSVVQFGSMLEEGVRNGVYKSHEHHGRGVKMVNMGELFAYPRLGPVPMRRVDLTDDELTRFSLKVGDLLFARRSLVAEGAGKCSVVLGVNEPTAFESSIIRARPNPTLVNSQFLYYTFNSPYGAYALGSILRHVAVAGITGSDLARLEIPLPRLPEQNAIAAILSALDDKIELNRRIHRTLEDMARALFKEWFVVRADDSWEEKPLDDIAQFLNGLALQKFPAQPGEDSLPVIKIAQLRTMNTEGADQASAKLDPAYIVNDGDVLFSWSGSLEVVIWTGGRGALNQHLFKVTSEQYPKWFYYLWTYWHLPEFQQIAAGKATTMGHIQRQHLHSARVLVPPETTLSAMSARMAPLIERMTLSAIQNRTLAALRDALLPKLISGQIRVTV